MSEKPLFTIKQETVKELISELAEDDPIRVDIEKFMEAEGQGTDLSKESREFLFSKRDWRQHDGAG